MDSSTTVALGMTTLVIFVLLYVWIALALSALYRKAGEEGWKGWVPILNQIILLRLGGFSGWLILLALVPVLGQLAYAVVQIMACFRINKAFGFGAGMTVLAALVFPVWASVLGFGSARWLGAEQAAAGPRRAESAATERPAIAGIASDRRAAYVPLLSSEPAAGAIPPPPPAPVRAESPGPVAPSTGWAPPPLPPQPAAPAYAPAPLAAAAHTNAFDEDFEGVDDPITPPVPPVPPAPPAPDAEAQLDDLPTEYNPTSKDTSWGGFDPSPSRNESMTDAVEPISAAPVSRPTPEPTAPSPAVTRVPAAVPAPHNEPWAPAPQMAPEGFDETSGPVSAIVGAPDAGAPRSALNSVSALYTQPEIPADDPIDETVIARRRRTAWSIIPPRGAAIALTADVVIVGRRPSADAAFPRAQLVAIEDGTISKTHARLVLRQDKWYLTDLGSTNGVHFATFMGTEVEATPGVEIEAGEKFMLGDAPVGLVRSDA